MSDFTLSDDYTKWQKISKWKFFKYVILAVLLHIFLLILGYKRLMNLLAKFITKTKTQYYLCNEEQIFRFKKLVNPTFKRIRKSRYIWSNCFSSSILLWYILKKQGLDTEIIIGTNKDKGIFKAHAWVEYQQIPLNENKRIRKKYHVFKHDFSINNF